MAHELGVQVVLGRRLRSLRKEKKITQEELAESSGVSSKFIGKIERGTANPTVDVLDRLARGLEIDLWRIFRYGQSIAAEKVLDYLSGRPPRDIDRARRILEAALDDTRRVR